MTKFLGRVERVNATPEYLFRVDTVTLFGSTLSNAERLGDVNIAVDLKSKAEGILNFRNGARNTDVLRKERDGLSQLLSSGLIGLRRKFAYS